MVISSIWGGSSVCLLLFTGWSAEAARSHLDCAQASVSANAPACAQHFGLWTYPGTKTDLVRNSIAPMQGNSVSDILLWGEAAHSEWKSMHRPNKVRALVCVCVDIQGNCHRTFQHKPDVCVCVHNRGVRQR